MANHCFKMSFYTTSKKIRANKKGITSAKGHMIKLRVKEANRVNYTKIPSKEPKTAPSA